MNRSQLKRSAYYRGETRMANILKLQNAGDVATLNITGCEVVEGNYGQQVKFEAGDDTLYLPDTSAFRQLERIGLDVETAVGKRLIFSRAASTKPGAKPFWNIDLGKADQTLSDRAHGVEFRVPINGAIPPTPIPTAEPGEKPRLDRLYLRATRLVLDEVVPLYVKAGIGCSDTAVAAMTAALFIAASKEA